MHVLCKGGSCILMDIIFLEGFGYASCFYLTLASEILSCSEQRVDWNPVRLLVGTSPEVKHPGWKYCLSTCSKMRNYIEVAKVFEDIILKASCLILSTERCLSVSFILAINIQFCQRRRARQLRGKIAAK